MTTIDGSEVIAESLARLGVKTVFGIVGIPVVEVADALINKGIKFIGFRNEQAASYAASVYGYLTQQPGVLLVVGGPGLVHALAGIYNSQSNKWPLLVLAGSSSSSEIYRGGFQELDQVSLMTSTFAKFSAKPPSISRVPELITKAFRLSISGKPGPTYIDLPADIIQSKIDSTDGVKYLQSVIPYTIEDIPKSVAPVNKLRQAVELIKSAQYPLLVVGKGASNCPRAFRNFVAEHMIPFLPTPMGKGVVPDSSEFNVSSARSDALRHADVIILAGARLNWMLHHGDFPKFKKNVKFIQIDLDSDEFGDNSNDSLKYGLYGDIGLTIESLNIALGKEHLVNSMLPVIETAKLKNIKKLELKGSVTPEQSESLMNHNQALTIITDSLGLKYDDTVFVSEGANTMDISRVVIPINYPKQRLDAGTNATMGVGLGYAIAAKAASPEKLVIAIEGDSAFGFSAMEIETAIRSDLPLFIIVLNNSGIYRGVSDVEKYAPFTNKPLPSTALSYKTRYDELGNSLGAVGMLVNNANELKLKMKECLDLYFNENKTIVLNVLIQSGAGTKLEFGWQNKPKSKL